MCRLRCRILVVALLSVIAVGCEGLAADQPKSDNFDAKGVKIHCVVQGTGEPVVLIHGLHSSAGVNWQLPGTFAALARDHQVIALDMPGHGWSDKPDKDEAYGLQMVEDVALLMDHLKIKKAHIVGYSMGGMIAVKFLAEHPDRALSGTIGGMGWFRDGSGVQKLWKHMGDRGKERAPDALLSNMGKLAVSEEALKGIKVPTTVLVGSKDSIVKGLYVEPLKKARKDWDVIEIADADHFTCIIKKEFTDQIVKWVDKNTKK
jgi:pimeloyl-ACP methyl ester carboxylesterase